MVFAHQAKNNENKKEASIFGSVWELLKEQEVEANHLALGLYHRKANLGPLHKAMGFQVSCDRDTTRIHYEPANPADYVTLTKGLGTKERLKAALLYNVPKTAAALTEEIDGVLKTVKNNLTKLQDEGSATCTGDGWTRN